MKDKEKSLASSTNDDEGSVPVVDQSMGEILERLPSHYRKEILKQYDVPKVNISILTILRYGTTAEFCMQVVGTICAIAAGTTWETEVDLGAALPLMTIMLGDLTNLFGSFTSNSPSLTPVTNEQFKTQVTLTST
jgi:hypothetical protein